MWQPAVRSKAAHVVRCAEFAATNLDQYVPYLRFEPHACPVAVDVHIAAHERAVPVRAGIFARRRATFGKGRGQGSHIAFVSWHHAARLSSRRRWEYETRVGTKGSDSEP